MEFILLSHWEQNIFELIKIHRLDKNVRELLIIEYENLCCFVKNVLTKAEYNRCLNWFFLQNFKHNSRFKIDGLLKKCWVDCIITSLVVSDMIYRRSEWDRCGTIFTYQKRRVNCVGRLWYFIYIETLFHMIFINVAGSCS